ncbi:Acyl-CoA dehydrogenase [Saccharopolyspora kobensis]|uniref:Acyl-CoA dehydrogenase n=3 Tax=Saccharopolyspora kobensis TaxID=146035 RepID=A0A1H5XA17_9PSEU|nr:acyl-CoA dehydrogenase family protein [Saccharopolyspora kobensis]SEG08275.1 Acyl-CoA dehydrogenase [Saccharopolyspora kobensis]SFE45797.1 Acyl-CoA dehydrogenase [Saccharopolyspora kobensis]
MQLVLNQEQQELRSAVRKFLAEHAPPQRVRDLADGDGHDVELWRRLSTELGLTGLVVPEELGGSGAGHVERAVVLEELGRALAPVPFLATAVLATDVLLEVDDAAARAELLPAMASGELIAAVAWDQESVPTATKRDGGWVLDGRAQRVVSGDIAGVVLVQANTGQGTCWFRLRGEHAAKTPLRTLDPTRRLANLDFAAAPAELLSSPDPDAARSRVRDLAAVALSAEQLGGMAKVLEMTAEYAKVRVQFGRAIGSYQGVKHRLADMHSALEQAGAAVRYAAWAADADPQELPLAAALVQVLVAPANFQAAADAVQLHGGIGYTWEHDAHLYYKRAKASELLLGTPDQNRARLADLLQI